MEKYRIYALIHGQTLPIGNLAGCEIKYMSFDEQKKRSFSPIHYEFSDDSKEYKTYVTSLPFMDPMMVRAEYVAICNIEERDSKAALGGAIKQFDKLCAGLFLTEMQDIKSKTGKYYAGSTYLYQINKVYRIDENNKESEAELDLKSGHIFLPNRPERNEWRVKETEEFFNSLIDFKDSVFQKALKYLYSSSVGYLRLDSYEKVALDHFKSIELIINTLSSKETFKERADHAGVILELTTEDVDSIKKYWDARSNGDIAHSSHNDPVSFYPNQFPVPKGSEYPWAFLDNVARIVLLKYLDIRRRYFHVDIEKPLDNSNEKCLRVVNVHSDCNNLFFQTPTTNKKDILNELTSEFCSLFQVKEDEVDVEFNGSKERAVIFIKNPKIQVDLLKIPNKMIRISFR